jgi:hypothetical protein
MDQVTVDLQPTHGPSVSFSPLQACGWGETLEAESLPFSDPQEVLAYPALDISVKRAILASWASDACAVENLPNWRKLPEADVLVPLDDILDALRALDGGAIH